MLFLGLGTHAVISTNGILAVRGPFVFLPAVDLACCF